LLIGSAAGWAETQHSLSANAMRQPAVIIKKRFVVMVSLSWPLASFLAANYANDANRRIE
jgi:hypothetical protein